MKTIKVIETIFYNNITEIIMELVEKDIFEKTFDIKISDKDYYDEDSLDNVIESLEAKYSIDKIIIKALTAQEERCDYEFLYDPYDYSPSYFIVMKVKHKTPCPNCGSYETRRNSFDKLQCDNCGYSEGGEQ